MLIASPPIICPSVYQTEFSHQKLSYVRSDKTKKTLQLNLWSPVSAPAGCGPYPLVIFSHGYGGCGAQTLYFTEELARHGYIVIAPDHDDARCSQNQPSDATEYNLKQFSAGEVAQWTATNHFDRRDDLEAVINELIKQNHLAGSRLVGLIDESKIGLAGHSLGGYSVLGLAGARPTWRDERIKAVIAFSPFVKPYLLFDSFKNIKIPVMYQSGTLDLNNQNSDQVFKLSNAPKVAMILKLASHLAWSNFICRLMTTDECLQRNERVKIINQFAISFFDRYLKGQKLAEPLFTASASLIESLQYDLGASATVSATSTSSPVGTPSKDSLPSILIPLAILALLIVIYKLFW